MNVLFLRWLASGVNLFGILGEGRVDSKACRGEGIGCGKGRPTLATEAGVWEILFHALEMRVFVYSNRNE